MKFFRHILVVITTFLLASCAIDEVWDGGNHTEGEEVVMTFQPSFIDYSATTKAIGDGTQVDHLLVHVYETGASRPIEYTYEINNKVIDGTVSIPFIYGKEYKVYFFAYKAGKDTPYIIKNNGLKEGITISYPEENLNFNSLESLDAFYSVQTINLANNVESNVTLTRPFAQVNLAADKTQLLAAKATKVEISVNAATAYDFVKGPSSETSDLSFTFEADDYFQNNELISEGTVFLGTTYLFVQSGENLPATVTLYDEEGNVLKGPSNVEIPLVSNSRTNLVFTGVEPAGPSWDETEMKVPGADANGWIHITRPEQLAAFLLNTTADGAKVIIDEDIDMSETPDEVAAEIASVLKSVKSLTLNGNNKTISELNLSAFFNEATNLTVYDLTLSDIKVEGTGHVGVLVNTLKGESSFINVNVLNSSAATTDGAAGGMVGYIERINSTNRSEELNIIFDNCHVNGSSTNPVAEGTLAEGKFVGLFNGYDYRETLIFKDDCTAGDNTTVADFNSRYCEGYEAEWLESNTYSKYDGFLGDENYNRGRIIMGETIFVPMWDGVKKVTPMDADQTYDGWSSGKVIYSAFDLASLQELKSTSGNYYLCADVDLGGDGKDGQVGKLDKDRKMQECGNDDAVFKSINYIANLNGVKKEKIGSDQLSLTGSDSHTIYNCKVILDKHDGLGAGFIKQVTGTTNHSNINLARAYIYNHHDEDKPTQNYWEDDNGSGNAYAGTFVSTTGGTYNISNVRVYEGHVFALCKIGGIIGRVGGVLNMNNCSVDKHIIENYEANIINWYPMAMSVSSFTVYVNGSWYTQGECGGLIGFIQSTSASIKKCSVTNTDLKC